MKKIVIIVFLFILQISLHADQISENEFKKISLSNNIDVTFFENFRSPIIVVNITFHIKNTNEPLNKMGINRIIAENLINEDMHKKFIKCGARYTIKNTNNGIEIHATLNPKQLKNFFLLIYDIASNSIHLSNFDMLKKDIQIHEKLCTIYKSNDIIDNVFSCINTRNIYNDSAFNSIEKKDVETFFDNNFPYCHISIVLCGAVGYKSLLKILQSSISNLPIRDEKPVYIKQNSHIIRSILLENKYTINSARYVYTVIHENKKSLQIFWEIFRHEMFRILRKANKIAYKCVITFIPTQKDNVYMVSIFPKKDIAIDHLKNAYFYLTHRMSHVPITPERASEIAEISAMEKQLLFSNLNYVCSVLQKSYMNEIDIDSVINMSKEIKNIDPTILKSIANKVFSNSLLTEVKTQFNLGI